MAPKEVKFNALEHYHIIHFFFCSILTKKLKKIVFFRINASKIQNCNRSKKRKASYENANQLQACKFQKNIIWGYVNYLHQLFEMYFLAFLILSQNI